MGKLTTEISVKDIPEVNEFLGKCQSEVGELRRERDALAAHVERLYNKLEQLLHHPENGQARHEGYAILSSTPTTSLNTVRREVAVDSFNQAAMTFTSMWEKGEMLNFDDLYDVEDLAISHAAERYPDK